MISDRRVDREQLRREKPRLLYGPPHDPSVRERSTTNERPERRRWFEQDILHGNAWSIRRRIVLGQALDDHLPRRMSVR